MGFAKQLLAIVLAALVANPVCCCTLPILLRGAKDAQGCPSCCAEKPSLPDDSGPSSPEDSSPCPCAKSNPALSEGNLSIFEWNLPCVPGLPSPSPALRPDWRRADLVPVALLHDQPPPVPLWRQFGRYLL